MPMAIDYMPEMVTTIVILNKLEISEYNIISAEHNKRC